VALPPPTAQYGFPFTVGEMSKREYRALLQYASTPKGRKELREHAIRADDTDQCAPGRNVLPGLRLINCGSERTAFLLKVIGQPPIVFKVATARRAGNQTRSEVFCWRSSNNPLMPVFYGWASNFTWVEMQVLYPLRTRGSGNFEDLTHIPFFMFDRAMWRLDKYLEDNFGNGSSDEYFLNDPRVIRARRTLVREAQHYMRTRSLRGRKRKEANDFVRHVVNLIIDCRILPPELTSKENWGVTRRGKIKVLDLGGVPKAG